MTRKARRSVAFLLSPIFRLEPRFKISSLNKPATADDFTGMNSDLLSTLYRLGNAIAVKNGLAAQ